VWHREAFGWAIHGQGADVRFGPTVWGAGARQVPMDQPVWSQDMLYRWINRVGWAN